MPQAHARAARRATRPPAGAVLVRALRRQALPVQKLARPSEACLRPAAVHGVRDTRSAFLDLDFAALVDSKPCACLKEKGKPLAYACVFSLAGGEGRDYISSCFSSCARHPHVIQTCTRTCSLIHACQVREARNVPERFCFEIISPSNAVVLQAETQSAMVAWTKVRGMHVIGRTARGAKLKTGCNFRDCFLDFGPVSWRTAGDPECDRQGTGPAAAPCSRRQCGPSTRWTAERQQSRTKVPGPASASRQRFVRRLRHAQP